MGTVLVVKWPVQKGVHGQMGPKGGPDWGIHDLYQPCENHWRTLTGICSADFINFLLKANQQFVEMLPTTYIFQFCYLVHKQQSCVIGHDQEVLALQQIYWWVYRSQLYASSLPRRRS